MPEPAAGAPPHHPPPGGRRGARRRRRRAARALVAYPGTANDAFPTGFLDAWAQGVPVVAAGGIMDGAGIAAVLRLGAVAAQLGTAFVACPESSASSAYRAALLAGDTVHTVMTAGISGRPARCLANRLTALAAELAARTPSLIPPDYPIAYDAGKALHAAAAARGEHGYGAQWAGQGAPLARALPAPELVATLARELQAAARRDVILSDEA